MMKGIMPGAGLSIKGGKIAQTVREPGKSQRQSPSFFERMVRRP